jgi:hypothetical protein
MTIIVLPFSSIERIKVLPWDVQPTTLPGHNFADVYSGSNSTADEIDFSFDFLRANRLQQAGG